MLANPEKQTEVVHYEKALLVSLLCGENFVKIN